MKRGKVFLIISGAGLFIISNILLIISFLKRDTEVHNIIIFLVLINVNLIAFFILLFYVGKNLMKIYMDRKARLPGSSFRVQMVTMFIIVTLIPSVLLFFIGSGLVSNYIDRIFMPRIAFYDSSMKVTRAYYDVIKGLALKEAREVAERYPEAPEDFKDFNYRVIDETSLHGDKLLKEALSSGGATGIRIENGREVVRALHLFRHDGRRLVALVEHPVPYEITSSVEEIKKDYEESSIKRHWASPIKINFTIIFGFCTLLIIMFGLWTSLKISRRVIEPIGILTYATSEVAGGNLDVEIPLEGNGMRPIDDEVRNLMVSFNHMIKEVRESRRRLQDAYSEAERGRVCLKAILDNIKSGVISLDINGYIISVNPQAGAILRINTEFFIGRHYSELLSLIDSKELESIIKEIRIRDMKDIEKEVRIKIQDSYRILRVFMSGLRTSGDIIGLIVVFDDITDIVNAQKAIAWQEIASRIAHEVKNPLTPIRLSTERLIRKWKNRDPDFDEVFETSTRTIVNEVESLRRLVQDFARFGRMPEIKKRVVDIRDILRDVYALYLNYKNIDIRIQLPEEMVYVEVDPEQIKRAVINIMENAVE